LRAGKKSGPTRGVPFAVKNLFDVQGLDPCRIEDQSRPQAVARDATLIERMEAAGAVLLARSHGRYAYDFTGENVHDGPSRQFRMMRPG